MLIYTIWVNSKASFEEAWLLDAWDASSVEGNSEAFEEKVKKAKAICEEVRVIPVKLDSTKLRQAFEIPPIDGIIEST